VGDLGQVIAQIRLAPAQIDQHQWSHVPGELFEFVESKLDAVAAGLNLLPIKTMTALRVTAARDMQQIIHRSLVQYLANCLPGVFQI